MLEHYKKGYNLNSVSLMPCNLYGQNDNYDLQTSHVFPALIRKFVDAKLIVNLMLRFGELGTFSGIYACRRCSKSSNIFHEK